MNNRRIIPIIIALMLLIISASAAEIHGFVRAGNAITSGYTPCITLDGNCVHDALKPDGTFKLYSPEGDHTIGLSGELKGYEEYCDVTVKNGYPDHACTFEGNGLATPTARGYQEPINDECKPVKTTYLFNSVFDGVRLTFKNENPINKPITITIKDYYVICLPTPSLHHRTLIKTFMATQNGITVSEWDFGKQDCHAFFLTSSTTGCD